MILVFSAAPVLSLYMTDRILPQTVHFASALSSSLLFIAASIILRKKIRTGKTVIAAAFILFYISLLPVIMSGPFQALAINILLTLTAFYFFEFPGRISGSETGRKMPCHDKDNSGRAIIALFIITILYSIFADQKSQFPKYTILMASAVTLILQLPWAVGAKAKKSIFTILSLLTVHAILAVLTSIQSMIPLVIFLSVMICLLMHSLSTGDDSLYEKNESLMNILLNHPARSLLITFLGLCVLGTILLSLPFSVNGGKIDLIDAAFTSVSAVCVTGLIVKDTPVDFTLFGQSCILLLIQLGGLGIMSITTLALHIMGQRLSLMQERLMNIMTDTDHGGLIDSLKLILKFTFIAEAAGAVFLSVNYLISGDTLFNAVWRGIFTSVSAFCNAGFSLQSDSLIPYQNNPVILNTVAVLIILGGIAPATAIVIPRWLSRKPVPIPAKIALITSSVLLVSGTMLIMAFEWNGFLAGMSVGDKITNSWFQSVTLRTAGFNSVAIEHMTDPSLIIMAIFMFIGGSPGGTAGGIKTTTLGIIILTFWSNITNRKDIIIQNRKIPQSTAYRAITIIFAGMVVWLMSVIMLFTTQHIPARDLIFEATSAIGTVGLSTGATTLLDGIGKIVIILTMFTGRVGPMTIFTMLSDNLTDRASRYPEEKIFLT